MFRFRYLNSLFHTFYNILHRDGAVGGYALRRFGGICIPYTSRHVGLPLVNNKCNRLQFDASDLFLLQIGIGGRDVHSKRDWEHQWEPDTSCSVVILPVERALG
jgi:hypothetical protein